MSLLSNLQLFVPPLDPSNKAINQAGTTGHQSNSAPRRGVGLSNLPAFLTAQNQGQPLRFHRQRAGIHPAPKKKREQALNMWKYHGNRGNIMEIVEISWDIMKYQTLLEWTGKTHAFRSTRGCEAMECQLQSFGHEPARPSDPELQQRLSKIVQNIPWFNGLIWIDMDWCFPNALETSSGKKQRQAKSFAKSAAKHADFDLPRAISESKPTGWPGLKDHANHALLPARFYCKHDIKTIGVTTMGRSWEVIPAVRSVPYGG